MALFSVQQPLFFQNLFVCAVQSKQRRTTAAATAAAAPPACENPTASKYIRRAGVRAGGGVLQGCRKMDGIDQTDLNSRPLKLFLCAFSSLPLPRPSRWSGRGTRTWSTRLATPIFLSPPTTISSSRRPGWPTRATTRVWPRTSWLAAGATRPPCWSTVGDGSFQQVSVRWRVAVQPQVNKPRRRKLPPRHGS